jgi:ubiquitin C-terminal hydrolase
MSNAYQNNSLYNLPEVLIINLNRGKGNIYNVGINYNEIIDLSGEVETHIESSDTFKLICIISHFGPSSTSGHFIAFCYVERKGKWYEFNDSIVTESSFEEAKNKGIAYVLFYQRQ